MSDESAVVSPEFVLLYNKIGAVIAGAPIHLVLDCLINVTARVAVDSKNDALVLAALQKCVEKLMTERGPSS